MSIVEKSIFLYNATVITMEISMPRASWVYVEGSIIRSVGSGALPKHLIGSNTQLIDCQGMTIIPGFNDAHIHIFATASNSIGVDCGYNLVSSITDIGQRLKEKADKVTSDVWVKGFGYHEFNLIEKAHPTRWDLDNWVPHHPVRLRHSSGHAIVLNSKALALVGIDKTTADPVYGVIDRFEDTGEPTGLLLEMNEYLEGKIPPPHEHEINRGLTDFNRNCIQMGITSLQDANPMNSLEDWNAFLSKVNEKIIEPDVRMMVSINAVEEFISEGLLFGSSAGSLTLSSVKIMSGLTTGALYPPTEELENKIRYAGENGFQVAIHGVEAEVNSEIVRLMYKSRASFGILSNRIEHLSECPPELIADIYKQKITVVTQPGFIYYRGDKYKEEIPVNRQEWLYRIGSLHNAGVKIGIGSDSPVIPINPMYSIYSAITRKTASGNVLNVKEAVSVEDIIEMYTLGSAYAGNEDKIKGSIKPGHKADLIVLDSDPTVVDYELIKSIKNVMTIVSGEVLWQG